MATVALKAGQNTSILQVLAKPFVAIGNALVAIAEANPRLRQLEYLANLTDAELADKGLKREDIVQHVFPERYSI